MAAAAPTARGGRPPARSRPADWLILVIFGVGVAALVASLGELGLRVEALRNSAYADPRCGGSDVAQLSQKGLYVPDPLAGYVMRANMCVRLRTTEYDQVLRTNTQGIVGPEVASTKAPGEFRIVVLGDSYIVGGQVPYEQTFPAMLEADLHARGHTNVRVINMGVGGYSTFNEAGLLRENVDWLQPDGVVVAAFVGNDVAENVLATGFGYTVDPNHPKGLTFGPGASDLVQESIGWFPRNGNGSSPVAPVAPDTITRLKTTARQTWESARGGSLLLGALFGAPLDPSIGTAPGARAPGTDQRKLNLTSFEWTILRDLPPVSWLDQAWPLFGKYLSQLGATADSVPAPVLVLVIPQIAQVEPADRDKTMAEFRFNEDEVDWERPQRELAAQARAAGLPVLDLLPEFRAAPQRDDLYLEVDQHFTAAGHRTTAQLLADAIESSGWLK
jgi:lysophospholipase L1-like esterase